MCGLILQKDMTYGKSWMSLVYTSDLEKNSNAKRTGKVNSNSSMSLNMYLNQISVVSLGEKTSIGCQVEVETRHCNLVSFRAFFLWLVVYCSLPVSL